MVVISFPCAMTASVKQAFGLNCAYVFLMIFADHRNSNRAHVASEVEETGSTRSQPV
jgi:hypothetical protein